MPQLFPLHPKLRLWLPKAGNLLLHIGIGLLLAGVALLFIADQIVGSSQQFTYQNIDEIPYNKVAVILGTSKYLLDGRRNEYFANRISAAAELYRSGKASYFLVSGDNATRSYNEPREMRRELLKAGIPAERIYSDYAGFRTLDSIVRANAVFGQRSFTIVSQGFHNERAIFVARHFGINAIGFNAKDVDAYSGLKTRTRELMARVLCLVDLYLLDKQPKFLGEPVPIG